MAEPPHRGGGDQSAPAPYSARSGLPAASSFGALHLGVHVEQHARVHVAQDGRGGGDVHTARHEQAGGQAPQVVQAQTGRKLRGIHRRFEGAEHVPRAQRGPE
jgi:hypothetical protein